MADDMKRNIILRMLVADRAVTKVIGTDKDHVERNFV
jgi:hypothetical protein